MRFVLFWFVWFDHRHKMSKTVVPDIGNLSIIVVVVVVLVVFLGHALWSRDTSQTLHFSTRERGWGF